MKTDVTPVFEATVPGPWGVDTLPGGKKWYVIHKTTGRAKCIGPVGARRQNYFELAIEEANRRNKEHNNAGNRTAPTVGVQSQQGGSPADSQGVGRPSV